MTEHHRFQKEPWVSGIGLIVRLMIREWPGIQHAWRIPGEETEPTGGTDHNGMDERFEWLPKWPSKPYQYGIKGLLIDPPYQFNAEIRTEPDDESPIDERVESELSNPIGYASVPRYLAFLGNRSKISNYSCYSPQGGQGYFVNRHAFELHTSDPQSYQRWKSDECNLPESYKGDMPTYLSSFIRAHTG